MISSESKLEDCKLINILDSYGLKLSYPQSDDPHILEFWCDQDPRRLKSFNGILQDFNRYCTVQSCGNRDYFVRIIDDGYMEGPLYGIIND